MLNKRKGGFTFVESMIAVGVVSLIVIVFAGVYTLISANQNYRHRDLALKIATEQIEILKELPLAELTNRTDADLLYVPYNFGDWSVESGTAVSYHSPIAPYALKDTLIKPSNLSPSQAIKLVASEPEPVNQDIDPVVNDELNSNTGGNTNTLNENVNQINDNTNDLLNINDVSINENTNSAEPDSTNNVIQVNDQGSETGLRSVVLVPDFSHTDMTFEADMNIVSTNEESSNFDVGLCFHYKDRNNYMRASIGPSAVSIMQSEDGAESTIGASGLLTTGLDAWHNVRVETNGDVYEVYVDGTKRSFTPDREHAFSSGKVALCTKSDTVVQFDNVSVTNGGTRTWDFESEEIGDLPSGWTRFNITDLPSGVGKLTIQDYEGNSEIKLVTVRVEWVERGSTRHVELQTLISGNDS